MKENDPMSDHDALTALLHELGIGCIEDEAGVGVRFVEWLHRSDAARLLAAGVRVTGDAGLPRKDNGERLTYRDSGIANDRCSACGWGIYAHECPALAGDTPEAREA